MLPESLLQHDSCAQSKAQAFSTRAQAARAVCAAWTPPRLAICAWGIRSSSAIASIQLNLVDSLGSEADWIHISQNEAVGETCLHQLIKRESCVGTNFSAAVLLRSNMTWTLPVLPHCMYDWRSNRRFKDIIWVARSDAYLLATELTPRPHLPKDPFFGVALPQHPTNEDCVAWDIALPRHRLLPTPLQLPRPACPRYSLGVQAQEPSAAACKASGPPPRLALCISGLVRTFTHRLVYETIKGHLVDALGTATTVFAHLRIADERVVHNGNSASGGASLVKQSTLQQVHRALEYIGVAKRNAVVLRDANATGTTPSCAWYHGVPPAKGECMNYMAACALPAITGMLASRHASYNMVVHEEALTAARFDSVLFMRPDLAVLAPVQPFCLQPLGVSRNKNDHITWVRRDDLEGAFRDTALDFQDCRVPFGDDAPNGYNASLIDDFVRHSNHKIGPYGSSMYWSVRSSNGSLNQGAGGVENWLKSTAARHGVQQYQDDSLGIFAIVRQPSRSMPWMGHVCRMLAISLLVHSSDYNKSSHFTIQRFPYSRSKCYQLLHRNPANVPGSD
eukprot:Transcript_28062.p1 GENE.Transcript_28062~~Transcript_28062.p1  ORF type:complete len:564 (+),score=0.42 Transcript_28062:315-2006(+)